jgi:xanthine dehydrogenase YagR molybdenum-binding subunit
MQSIKDRAGKMDSTLHWSDLLKLPGQSMVEAEAQWEPTRMDKRTWSAYSFGAHFCQVAVDECLGKVSVQRWVAAFAAGRILNEKTARSQLIGGIVWGIGQALLEETVRDGRGRLVNANLSDYLVPVNADVPSLEVSLLAEEDSEVNPAGAKGLGELGICGAGAAIANAIFHATGHRFRDLPFKTELWFA